MPFQREPVGAPYVYEGRTIIARFIGPDLLGEVDGVELSGFFIDIEAVRCAGRRYVDDKIKVAAEDAAKSRRK